MQVRKLQGWPKWSGSLFKTRAFKFFKSTNCLVKTLCLRLFKILKLDVKKRQPVFLGSNGLKEILDRHRPFP